MNTKPIIVYCDDMQDWRNEFRKNLSKIFDIRDITNNIEFSDILGNMKTQGTSPDIILIDLFNPRHKIEDQGRWNIAGRRAIEQLERAIRETEDSIYDTRVPFDLYILLMHARMWHPRTPIAIYTQYGVSIVDDSGLMKVADIKDEWLLKGRESVYEKSRLLNMLESPKVEKEVVAEIAKHYAILTQKILWFIAAIIFFVSVICSWIFGQGFYNTLTIGATLASLFITIISFGVPFFERYKRKDN